MTQAPLPISYLSPDTLAKTAFADLSDGIGAEGGDGFSRHESARMTGDRTRCHPILPTTRLLHRPENCRHNACVRIMEPLQLLIVATVYFFAAFVKGITGLGYVAYGYVAYCVQKLLSRKSGHGTRLLVEVDLLTKE